MLPTNNEFPESQSAAPLQPEGEDLSPRSRAPLTYEEPSGLPTPDPMTGYTFRWIAEKVYAESNVANVTKSFDPKEGWVPVDAQEQPNLARNILSTLAPKSAYEKPRGQIRYGGLILCKRPVEKTEARDAFYKQINDDLVKKVASQNMDPSAQSRGGGFNRPEMNRMAVFGKNPQRYA